MKRKTAHLFVLMLCMAVVFAGCAPLGMHNVTELLRAPALGSEEGDIQKAVADMLKEEPQYKFPRDGEHRSPILIEDLDGDGTLESVVFYSVVASTQNPGRTNNVYMAVLRKENNAWTVVQDVGMEYRELASVEVAPIFADGSRQLIIGCADSASTEKMLYVFKYSADKAEYQITRVADLYFSYRLDDFTGDGFLDLAVACPPDENTNGPVLNFFTGRNNVFEPLQRSVELNPNLAFCTKITAGVSPQGHRMLVVDGQLASGFIVSQMLRDSEENGYYVRGDSAEFMNMTMRYSPLLLSRDVDRDGVVEIPIDSEKNIQGLSTDNDLKWLTWYDYSSLVAVQKQFGILDVARASYIRLPDEWQDLVEVVDGKESGEWLVKSKETGKTLLSMLELDAGAGQADDKAVSGSPNWYLRVGKALTELEKSQVSALWLA